MVLLLAATLVGSGITLALMWPLGLLIAIASAPLGGSLLTAVAAISLVIRNSRLIQEGPTSLAHGRPPARLGQPLRHYPPRRVLDRGVSDRPCVSWVERQALWPLESQLLTSGQGSG